MGEALDYCALAPGSIHGSVSSNFRLVNFADLLTGVSHRRSENHRAVGGSYYHEKTPHT